MRKELFLISILFLIGCSSQPWSADEQTDFVQACREEGGSKSYCNCYMDKLMEEYPIYEDIKSIDFETKIELSKDCD
ncbi:MAG: hypothetical protein ACWA41_00250 [Putridiphycobacter sp.]